MTRRNEVQPGTTYGVVSRVPVLEPNILEQATEPPPADHRRAATSTSPTSPTPSASWPPTSPPAAPPRTRSPSCSRTGSSGTSPTTWPSPGATRPPPSTTSSRSAGATASSSRAPTPPWPARSASRPGRGRVHAGRGDAATGAVPRAGQARARLARGVPHRATGGCPSSRPPAAAARRRGLHRRDRGPRGRGAQAPTTTGGVPATTVPARPRPSSHDPGLAEPLPGVDACPRGLPPSSTSPADWPLRVLVVVAGRSRCSGGLWLLRSCHPRRPSRLGRPAPRRARPARARIARQLAGGRRRRSASGRHPGRTRRDPPRVGVARRSAGP